MSEQQNFKKKKPPRSRTGIPVKSSDQRRRVLLLCHGWVKEPIAKKNEWIWCEECSDWCQVQDIIEMETS